MNIKVNISITQEDINLGCKENESNCPVARAIHRATNNDKIRIGTDLIYQEPNKSRFIDMDDELKEWIRRFDNNDDVEPLNTWVHLPDDWVKKSA